MDSGKIGSSGSVGERPKLIDFLLRRYSGAGIIGPEMANSRR
jgi:hypothetical protein